MNNLQSFKRVLAIDPSLISSGWALFKTSPRRCLAFGTIRTQKVKCLESRLKSIQTQVNDLYTSINLSASDLVLVEDATKFIDPLNLIKVERVRAVFEVLARSSGIETKRIHARTIQRFVMGLTGRQLKREIVKACARQTAWALYRSELMQIDGIKTVEDMKRCQDIVDALLIGHYATSQINGKSYEPTVAEGSS